MKLLKSFEVKKEQIALYEDSGMFFVNKVGFVILQVALDYFESEVSKLNYQHLTKGV